MKVLLIVAHGSRREESNQEVRRLAARISADGAAGFDAVDVAFLELAHPSIPEGLGRWRARGAAEIVVFPYFLAPGRHVAEDIPGAVEAFVAANPAACVRVCAHLGESKLLPQAILALAAG